MCLNLKSRKVSSYNWAGLLLEILCKDLCQVGNLSDVFSHINTLPILSTYLQQTIQILEVKVYKQGSLETLVDICE